MTTTKKLVEGMYVFVNGQEGVLLGEYMPGMHEVRLPRGTVVVSDDRIHTMCAWCADKPATYMEYCDSCKGLL